MNRKKFSLLAHFEIYIFLFILFSIFFPGCGGGGSSNAPQTAPSQQFTTDPNTGALKLVFEIPQEQNGNRLTTIDCSSVDTSRCRNRNNIENTRLTSKIPANTAKVWVIVFRGNIFAARSAANVEGSLDPNETNFSPQRRKEHRKKNVEGSSTNHKPQDNNTSAVTPYLENRAINRTATFQTAGYIIDASSSAAPKDGRVTLFLNNILPGFKTVGIWTEDSSGNITAESFEFVEIEADKISSMDTTLGLVMDAAGKFYTNSLNIAPGETLAIKTMRDGSTTFTPTAGSNCPTITLKKYGILNCTIISPATGTVTYNTGITGSAASINISGTVPSKLLAADPSADTTFGIAPLTVNFTGGATALGETVSSYAWNFGDGAATSTEPSPSHTYTREGTYNVSFKVTAASGSSNTSYVRIVVLKNNAPVITSAPVTTAAPNTAYTYDVNATDADGDTLTYSLTCLTCPTSPTINSTTGLINWTPTAEGVSSVTVAVADGKATTTQNFAITVSAAPVTPPPSSGSGGNSYFPLAVGNKWYYRYDEWFEGESHSWFEELDKVEIVRTETSSGKTVYVVSGTPEGSPTERKMYFENSNYYQDGSIILKQPASVGQTWTGTFKRQVLSTTETVSAGGNTYTGCVKIKVGDYNHYEYYKPGIGLVKVERINVPLGSTSSGQYINVLVELVSYTIVGQTNSPPTANAGADQTVTAGTQVTLDASGSSDADGDTLTYSWAQSSGTVTLQLSNSSTSKPIFTPTATGSYIFSLVVNDGKTNSSADTVTITITSANRTPTITSTAVATATVGTVYSYDVNATDADGDTLTYSLTCPTCLPSPTINSTTGLISWTPTATGSYNVVTSVSDSKGGIATQGFAITVSLTATQTNVCGKNIPSVHPVDITVKGVEVHGREGDFSCWSDVYTDGVRVSPGSGQGKAWYDFGPIAQNVSLKVTVKWTDNAWSTDYKELQVYNYSTGSWQTISRWNKLGTYTETFSISVDSNTRSSGGTVRIALWGASSSVIHIATIIVSSQASGNNVPTITSTAVTTATVGTAYSYDVNATDADGDTLIYSLTCPTCPTSPTINSTTGLISWTPSAAGSNNVTVSVSDSKGGTATQGWIITVSFGNLVATAVSAGGYHSCALLQGGSIKCWGANNYGQIGNATNTNSSIPVSVSGISDAKYVMAGGSQDQGHSCAILSDNSIKCWGHNEKGQLGNGANSDSNVPAVVSGISNAVSVKSGAQHTCALLSDGSVKCWGGNTDGQLGNGTNSNSNTPVAVSGITNASTIAIGTQHSCALLSDGSVKCWGFNGYLALGNATNNLNSNIPVSVLVINNATKISAGGNYNCALLSDGTIKCWGLHSEGSLGIGSNTTGLEGCGLWGFSRCARTPLAVSGIANAISVSAGGWNFSLALLSDGSIKSWGSSYWGMLGNGTNMQADTPVSVLGITNAISIEAGGKHACALLSDNTIKCWGNGYLGNGTTAQSNKPVSVIDSQ